MRLSSLLLALWLLTATAPIPASAARIEAVSIPGATLKGNPLGDPLQRKAALFSPDDIPHAEPLPLVIYLPGWGGSSEDALRDGAKGPLGQVIDRLVREKQPVRIAVVDGRSRFGGSQFVNSPAVGRYGDYVVSEICERIEDRVRVSQRILAGHSSGGYGALLLGSGHQDRFAAVVALSPDSDFDVTHRPLARSPNARKLTLKEVQATMAPPGQFQMPRDGMATLVVGLCAFYAPVPEAPGTFEWLYDEKGRWRDDVWARWLNADPLNVVRSRPDPFSKKQRIYLDGAEHDEFGANIGARRIGEELTARQIANVFHEAPGNHSDNLEGRLEKGLKWVLAPRTSAATR